MNSETRFLALVVALVMFWAVSSAVRESVETVAPQPTVAAPTGPLEPSDVRLKERVHDLAYGLPELMSLRPVSYRLKSFPSRPKIGLIAQEVRPVIPEVVYLSPENPEEIEPRYYSINYSELVPLLVRSIQEQQGMIAELQSRLSRLESPVTQ